MAQVYTFTDSNGEIRLMAEINPAPGGSQPVLVATKTLQNADVIALPTTPFVLIATPGASSVIIPIHATLRLAWTADYTGIDAGSTLFIANGTNTSLSPLSETNNTGVSGLLAPGGPDGALAVMPARADVPPSAGTVPLLGSSGFFDSDLADKPVQLGSGNALVFGGGDPANTLKVTVLYYVVTF